jgi:Zn-dependent protease
LQLLRARDRSETAAENQDAFHQPANLRQVNEPATQLPAAPIQASEPAPAQAQKRSWLQSVLSWLALAGVVAIKFKAVLFSALSFVASVGVYTLFWGWKFALVFTLLIFVHEMGHALFMRIYGVPGSLPYFIPGFGALINIKGRPASVLHESYIALAGPLVGSLGALACLLYALATKEMFWFAAAYTGFFINLFNLFPVLPLDGGRVVGAISPRIWVLGFAAMIVAAITMHWWNPLLLILILLGLPRAFQAWSGAPRDDAYYRISPLRRGGIALCYFGLAAALMIGMLYAHVPKSALG